MGKNWKGNRKGGGGGGGGKGGGHHDIPSCRGHAVVLCTCDVVREKEASKELVNLLNEAVESCYPDLGDARSSSSSASATDSAAEVDNHSRQTVQDMLTKELDDIRESNRSGKQLIVSVYTGIKGIILAKITNRLVCPRKLVYSIFDKVSSEKLPCCRHLVRMVPLQWVFYPNDEELALNVRLLLAAERLLPASAVIAPDKAATSDSSAASAPLVGAKRNACGDTAVDDDETSVDIAEKKVRLNPTVRSSDIDTSTNTVVSTSNIDTDEATSGASEESVVVTMTAVDTIATVDAVSSSSAVTTAAAALPISSYSVLFKARNHNTLKKLDVQRMIREAMPYTVRTNFMNPQSVLIVEALMNIGGISLVSNYSEYLELNLRKFQQQYTSNKTAVELDSKQRDLDSIVPVADDSKPPCSVNNILP